MAFFPSRDNTKRADSPHPPADIQSVSSGFRFPSLDVLLASCLCFSFGCSDTISGMLPFVSSKLSCFLVFAITLNHNACFLTT